jgi:hypothetical protein
MICCDQCSAWQHNDCMGLKFAKGEEPAEYYCEQCRPENHKELLERMARGEKPWEEAAKVRAQQAQERKQKRRKGGKRGRKPRASEAKSEANEPGPESAAATPSRAASQSVHEEQTRTPSAPPPPPQEPAGSQKRKFDDHKADGSQEPVRLPPEVGAKQSSYLQMVRDQNQKSVRYPPRHLRIQLRPVNHRNRLASRVCQLPPRLKCNRLPLLQPMVQR